MKKHSKRTVTKAQRAILITSAIILLAYIILAYFITYDAFWNYAGIYVLLVILIIPFIWLDNTPEVINYFVVTLGLIGAVTALGIMLFYLTILNNLANG